MRKFVGLFVFILALLSGGVVMAQSTATPLAPGVYEFFCGTGRLRHSFVDGNVNLVRLTCTTNGEGVPLPTPTATSTPTSTPVPLPTNTPVSPTATPVVGNPSSPDWRNFVGMTGEYGMSPQTFEKLMQDASSGAFNRPCTKEEHDNTKWHTLLNYDSMCHYDHQHGDNPYSVNDLFGEVGSAFNVNQSISYPWQTYSADSNGNATLDSDGSLQWENEYKHGGYSWAVRRNQCANGDPNYCVDAFRIQYHASVMGRATRWHSYSAEIRVCVDGRNPATCTNAQIGGWIDTFALFTPTYESSSAGLCDNPFNSDYFSGGARINDFGLSNQFVQRNDPDLQDEQRCHRQLPDTMISQFPNGLPYSDVQFSAPAEWWHHTPWDFRFNILFYNPFAETDINGNLKYYCDVNDASCRWTQSRNTLNVDYVFPVMSWHQGFSGFVTRFGDYGNNCTLPGLDCIYANYSNVQRNPNGLGYVHTRDGENQLNGKTQPFNYDITPSGIPSWITWFRMMM